MQVIIVNLNITISVNSLCSRYTLHLSLVVKYPRPLSTTCAAALLSLVLFYYKSDKKWWIIIRHIFHHMARSYGTHVSIYLTHYMGPVHHDVVVYSDSMSCLQAIEGEDTENPFISHIMNLIIEWQGHTCSFLLSTKPLWHWRKWKSRPTSKRDPRPRYRPTGKCPLYRFETTGQLLQSEVGSNQVGCSCTWQRSLSCETNTGATEEVPAPNQSWRGCNHPTSNWPYQGHQIPYLVPRTANWLSPLWSNTDHWPYAAGVCIVTGMSWWILHSRLVECSLRDNSWDLHSRVPASSCEKRDSSIWYDVIY